MRFVINNFGATTSLRNIVDELGRADSAVTLHTVSKYVKALVDAKILYECPRFDLKSKKSLNGEKKYYLSDLGFFFTQNSTARMFSASRIPHTLIIIALR